MISIIRISPPVLARLATYFVILTLLGCVVVPIPTTRVEKREFERDIDEQSALVFTVGKTTRREILLNLGQPDGVMGDEQGFIYVAEANESGYTWRFLWGVAILSPYSGYIGGGMTRETAGPPTEELYHLAIWFDEEGLVKDYEFKRAKQK